MLFDAKTGLAPQLLSEALQRNDPLPVPAPAAPLVTVTVTDATHSQNPFLIEDKGSQRGRFYKELKDTSDVSFADLL